jgi:endonuclease/exonuclease/phosphatase (EEP) superfamily protein YafD
LRLPRLLPLLLLAALALATGLAVLAPFGWPFELFAHFRAQYVALAVLLVPLLAVQRRGWAVAAAVLLCTWHVLPAARRAAADRSAPACGGPSLTVVTANVHYRSEERQPYLDWLAAQAADLVVVQEVTPEWAEALSRLPGYPYRRLLSREDPYGIAVLSRWPFESLELVDFAGDGLPSMAGVTDLDGQRLHFIGLHTNWPVLPALARARDRTLFAAAARARASELPLVVLGDLNATPDAPAFTKLLRNSGLRDSLDGRRWRPTWQAGFWPLAIRIDHVLVSKDVCVEHAEVGPDLGSDHRPVIARLRLRSGSPDPVIPPEASLRSAARIPGSTRPASP